MDGGTALIDRAAAATPADLPNAAGARDGSKPVIYPVVLSGGSGTRLWPLSRTLYPKQLLPLAGPESLLQQTVLRVAGRAGFAAPLIVANEEHRFIIAEQLRACGIAGQPGACGIAGQPGACGAGAGAVVLEPFGRNTAPAAAVAALRLVAEGPEALMLVMPSDHRIGDVAAFHRAVETAAAAARAGYLVSFGIAPERGETGYGYIARGGPLAACDGAFAIAGFIEKPDAAAAGRYAADGAHFWNAGIFLFPAALYLAELERLRPDMVAACRAAVAGAASDADFIRLDRAAFAGCPADSIDYAVMEHTARAAVVPVEMGWSDLGSWDALWAISDRDAHGNAVGGNVVAEDTRNCYLRSEAGLLAAVGVEDLVVVATDDAVMVAPRQRTQDVRKLVARLSQEQRDEAEALSTVHRPWGTYKGLHHAHRVQVKHIVVKPGGKLSLQMHHHRAEHWVVVQGTARITRGSEQLTLTEDQSTYIPIGTAHRLENPGKIPLHVIEVQSGSYLGEDDIVRFDDQYGRE